MYNKRLNLTEEMILNEKDINVIRQWKSDIEKEMNDFQMRTCKYEKLNYRQKMVQQSLTGLWKMCRSRISEHIQNLKEQGVWKSERDRRTERHLGSVFMRIAKEELDEDVFENILNKAKTKINEG